MATPLLSTKFYPPPLRSQLVSRARLIERIEQGLRQNCKLVLISAPAGFGKTTLVVETCRLLGCRAAWLSLDEADNDLTRFWRYAVAAFRRASPQVGELAQQMLDMDKTPAIETVLTSLINDLAGLEESLLLVLDDYHVIEAAVIHESVNFLLDHLPAPLHLLITTRADPPLALARRRARLEMVEVRAAELRFSLEDSAQFLNTVMKLGLDEPDIIALLRRTEGWAAGLQMAALAMTDLPDATPANRHAFIASFAGDDQYVGDYLVEEVLQRQTEPVQTFLLQTAVLERFNAALCQAVIGDLEAVNAQALLEMLEHRNLFLVPLDSRKEWYRYHRLFAELLVRRLRQVYGVEEETALHLRASRWFESQRLWTEAYDHARQANNFQRAAELVEAGSQDMFRASQLDVVRDWARRLPREVVFDNLQVCMTWSWAALATGRLEETLMVLSEVENRLKLSTEMLNTHLEGLLALNPYQLFVLVQIAIQRSTIAVNGRDITTGMRLAQDVLRCLSLLDRREPYLMLYAYETVAYFNLGLGYEALGEAGSASEAYGQALVCARREINLHILPMATAHLGQLALVSGRLEDAGTIYREALRTAGDLTGHPSPYVSQLHAGLGQVLYEQNHLDEAEAAFRRSLTIGRPWNNWESLIPSAVGLARLMLARGNPAAALEAIDEVNRDWMSLYQSGPLTILQGWRALLSSDEVGLSALITSLADRREWMQQANLPYSNEMLGLLRARLFLAIGSLEEARELLSQLAQAAGAGERSGIQIQALSLMGLALRGLNRDEEALAAFEQALALARPAGYRRTFIDLGLPAARLLVNISTRSERSDLSDYATGLLGDFPAGAWQIGGGMPEQRRRAAPVVEALSEREAEVLALMADGLSNAEIAARLYITHGTVKVHANNIYSKLGVKSRTAAVAKARLLGILP